MRAGTGIHMTQTQLRAWTRFLEASRLLEDVLSKHLKTSHQMLHSEYEILVRVDGAGGRMRMGRLASEVIASHSRISHTINRLEERGWVSRERAGEDGRGFDVVISELGTRELADASEQHAELIKQLLLAEKSDDELASMADDMQLVVDRIHATDY